MTSTRALRRTWRRLFAQFTHPTRVVVAAFGSALLVGTLLLSLPVSG